MKHVVTIALAMAVAFLLPRYPALWRPVRVVVVVSGVMCLGDAVLAAMDQRWFGMLVNVLAAGISAWWIADLTSQIQKRRFDQEFGART